MARRFAKVLEEEIEDWDNCILFHIEEINKRSPFGKMVHHG